MLNDLFINAIILISFTFVGGSILKELPKDFIATWLGKIMLSIYGGVLGVLLIKYNIKIQNTDAILDLRVLVIMIINYVGGFFPTLIASFIIGAYRIMYGGINQAAVLAVVDIALYQVIFYLLNIKIKKSLENWFIKLAAVMAINIITIAYVLRGIDSLGIILLTYLTVTFLSAIFLYYLLTYIKRSNELFRMYREDATKDHLTGLNNTRAFDDLINATFEKVIENKEVLSCLMIDIDHFKTVNDTYGHAIGDVVLKELASLLKKNCRTFDIIGRIGGEEFCALLLDCTQERGIEIGNKIKNAVKEHNFPIGEDKYINITVSVGTSTYPNTVESLAYLMKQADDALYNAKRSGRDRVCSSNRCFIE